ncbi:MAG: peptide chain release factor N(5)-glutamine methyltransferase [Acidimicrobiales bacterium]
MSEANATERGTAGDSTTIPWRRFLGEAAERLRAAGFGSAEVEARRIVEEVTGAEDAAELHELLDRPATVRGVARFDALLARREAGEPLQYVLGRWGFRRLDLMVDRRVLIPRPETELVTEVALAEIDRVVAAVGASHRARLSVVDLGAGSGAIALSLAAERVEVDVWGVEASADALAVASANLAGIGRPAWRVRLLEGSWYEPLPAELAGSVGVVVSNPPYIAEGEQLPAEVADWEPAGALVAGPTGLEAIEAVVSGAVAWLAPQGAVVVEIAPHQADDARDIAAAAGFAQVAVRRDLTGRDRVLVGRAGPRPEGR